MAHFKFNPITRQFNVVKDSVDLGNAFQGFYDNGTAYTVGQAVFSAGKIYVCSANTAGNPPPDALYWVELELQGPAGPQGETGPIGPANDTGVVFIAGETLGGHRMVSLDADSKAVYADNTDPTHAGRVIGLTLGSAVVGTEVTVRSFGLVTEPSWSWDVTKPRLFLATTGQITQTPPTSGFVCVIGYVVSAAQLFITIQPSINLI